jgi:hypothetical protein
MFPGKAAGLGLLILRCCVATHLLLAAPWDDHFWKVLAIVIASIGLYTGALSQVACILCLALEASFFKAGESSELVQEALQMGIVISVALLGPGAFSIDAKRFGLRRILPPLE